MNVTKTLQTLKKRRAGSLCCIGLYAIVQAAWGQDASTDPGALQRQNQDSLIKREQEKNLQRKPVVPEITTPAEQEGMPGSDEKNIRVERFEVDASSILTQAEIDAVLDPLRGRTVSLNDLNAAVAALNKRYAEHRAVTARAILPPQTIQNGIVRIRLIEAKVGKVSILGNQSLRAEGIASRLHLQAGDLMSVPALEEDLIRFNRLYENQLRANVAAGSTFGTTDVEVTVNEVKPHRYTFFLDNAGRDTIGETRLGLIGRFANLNGHSDSLQFIGTATEASRNFSVAYGTPINSNDLRFDVSASYGTIKIIDGPFQPLDITGQSNDVTMGLTQPLQVTLDKMWNAYSRLSARKSRSEFGGFEQQNQDLRVLTLGTNYESRRDETVWSADGSLVFGIPYWGGEQSFTYLRTTATRLDKIGERFQLVLRGGLQYSPSEILPSSEQFQIGGAYTVRGFSEGLLTGRSGYFGSVELRFGQSVQSYIERGPNAPIVQGLVFFDHGGVFPYRPGAQKEVDGDDFLTSFGVGALFEYRQRLSGRFIVAQPLHRNPSELRDRGPRFHFTLNVALD